MKMIGKYIMTKEEREQELGSIKSDLGNVLEDCIAYRNRLEEIGCKSKA